MKSLEESEQLLGELSVMCRQKQTKVSGFSEAPPPYPQQPNRNFRFFTCLFSLIFFSIYLIFLYFF